MECITIEIETESSKNIVVSCIYRAPGSCIDQFNKKIAELCKKHNDKVILVCGGLNIDFLKSSDHPKTTEFVNTMFSLDFYPFSGKPNL